MYANVNAAPNVGANVNAAPTMVASQPYMPQYMMPSYGYCPPGRTQNTFVLIVVLFILLIIVGAANYC
ncbi:YjcZ family sporulation protein [Aquibacillus koreensis]|uniref:YjcZ family sporulation protein n=1 Tax=Aquibacillus koreensis TaxID=279446 RepID=UPI0038994F4D